MNLLSRRLVVLAILLFGFNSQALAQGANGQSRGSGNPLELYIKAGIDGEQEGEIRKLIKEFESAHRVRLKTLYQHMKDLRDLQLQPDPSEEEVLAKQDDINKVSNVIATERIKLMLKIRKVLTPSQRQKLVALVRVRATPPDDRKSQD